MVSFTATKRSFAGLSLEGSKFSAESERKAAYYRLELTTEQVVPDTAMAAPEIEAPWSAL